MRRQFGSTRNMRSTPESWAMRLQPGRRKNVPSVRASERGSRRGALAHRARELGASRSAPEHEDQDGTTALEHDPYASIRSPRNGRYNGDAPPPSAETPPSEAGVRPRTRRAPRQ